jgi:hypothetical protein
VRSGTATWPTGPHRCRRPRPTGCSGPS